MAPRSQNGASLRVMMSSPVGGIDSQCCEPAEQGQGQEQRTGEAGSPAGEYRCDGKQCPDEQLDPEPSRETLALHDVEPREHAEAAQQHEERSEAVQNRQQSAG
jgi:hypothetical protein